MNNHKPEYRIISEMVRARTSVLDLGCGDGELLELLTKNRQIIRSQGIEIDEQAIYKCVKRGLSVFHGDIDSGLSEYDDNSFDYVILNQSLQQVRKPDTVLSEALRVGKDVIVGFPNFAHIKARFHLGVLGKAPITRSLPYEWHNTPNIHFLSVADFIEYCDKRNITIKKRYFMGNKRQVYFLPNVFALLGIFMITRKN